MGRCQSQNLWPLPWGTQNTVITIKVILFWYRRRFHHSTGNLADLWGIDRSMGSSNVAANGLSRKNDPYRVRSGPRNVDERCAPRGCECPDFCRTIEIHLVETSKTLRACQAKTLSAHRATWHNTIETIPEGPSILIANEFFDALPIRQFQKELGGWSERCIVLFDGALSFESHLLAEEPFGLPQYTNVGDVYEICPMALTFVNQIAARLVQQPGAALIIDYGYERAMPGDSLQAVRHHAFTDPLTDPGKCRPDCACQFRRTSGYRYAFGLHCVRTSPPSHVFLERLGFWNVLRHCWKCHTKPGRPHTCRYAKTD